MRHLVPVRLVAVALAAGSLIAVPLAEAAASAVMPVTCTKLVAPAPEEQHQHAARLGMFQRRGDRRRRQAGHGISKLTAVITWNAKKGTTTLRSPSSARPRRQGQVPDSGTIA